MLTMRASRGLRGGHRNRSLQRSALLMFSSLSAAMVFTGGAIQASAGRFARGDGGYERDAELPVVPPRAGFIKVVADPWAEVFIDGDHVMTTPSAASIPLPPGKHYLKYQNPYYQEQVDEVVVRPGETEPAQGGAQAHPFATSGQARHGERQMRRALRAAPSRSRSVCRSRRRSRTPPIVHVVRPGETLASIAERYYGDPRRESVLVAENGLTSEGGSAIVVGLRLSIPTVSYHRVKEGRDLDTARQRVLRRAPARVRAHGSQRWQPRQPARSGRRVVGRLSATPRGHAARIHPQHNQALLHKRQRHEHAAALQRDEGRPAAARADRVGAADRPGALGGAGQRDRGDQAAVQPPGRGRATSRTRSTTSATRR